MAVISCTHWTWAVIWSFRVHAVQSSRVTEVVSIAVTFVNICEQKITKVNVSSRHCIAVTGRFPFLCQHLAKPAVKLYPRYLWNSKLGDVIRPATVINRMSRLQVWALLCSLLYFFSYTPWTRFLTSILHHPLPQQILITVYYTEGLNELTEGRKSERTNKGTSELRKDESKEETNRRMKEETNERTNKNNTYITKIKNSYRRKCYLWCCVEIL